MESKLIGTGVALVTPIDSDFSVDYDSLKKLLDHVIEGGVDYLVVQGTTGESPVFSWTEKLRILTFIIDYVDAKLPVVFGLGGNNTYDLIEKAKDLKDMQIDAILSASPYYSKPSQEGILRHYKMLADAFPAPIILYNVPSRTASNMEAGTTLALSKHPNIIAMKEASGDLDQCKMIIDEKPDDFLLLSGDDGLTHEMIKQGAEGVISVIANLIPDQFSEMVNLVLKGDYDASSKKENALKNSINLSMKEGNPSSIKAGLESIGICSRTVKPPLFDASDDLVKDWGKVV
ncbi:MAG: 4-hydroxy-tetrahydrodipicolinate synthase [Ekhidna sp.]